MPTLSRPSPGTAGARAGDGAMKGAVLRILSGTFARVVAGGVLCSCETGAHGRAKYFPLQEIRPGGGISVELQYKTDRNITGKPLYPPNFKAYATAETAKALKEAAAGLAGRGYELVLLDAWRPPFAAALLWNEAVRRNLRTMYAPPSVSGHTRGTSVDVTLRSLGGKAADMPGDYDCHVSGDRDTTHSRILGEAMRGAGFVGHRGEWWHFDHPSGKKSGIVDNPWEKRGRRVVFSTPGS